MISMKARARAAWMPVLALSLVSAVCDRSSGPDRDAPSVAAAPASSPDPAAVAEPAPVGDRGNPLATLSPAEPEDATFSGVVSELLPAGGYTYLRVATEEGDRWVATMGQGAPVGHRVLVKNMGTRHDFHSKRLGRRFDALAFGIVREA